MHTVCAVTFGIGLNVPREIGYSYEILYEKLAVEVFAKKIQIESAESIPVAFTDLSDFEKLLVDVNRFIEKRNFEQYNSLVIDLTYPEPNTYFGHASFNQAIFNVITDFLRVRNSENDSSQNDKHSILLIIPELQSEIDPNYKKYLQLVSEGALLIVDLYGKQHTKDNVDVFKPANLVGEFARAKGDLIERLKSKTIKRTGHFVRHPSDDESRCSRYYYNCDEALAEVRALITEKSTELLGGVTADVCVVLDEYSDWFERAVVDYSPEEFNSASFFNYKFDSDLAELEGAKDILVVMAMVDTGKTLSKLVSSLKYNNSSVNLYFVSVLSSGLDKTVGNIRKVVVGAATYDVHYFLDVKKSTGSKEDCEVCKNKINYRSSIKLENDRSELSSYEFWSMVWDFDLTKEKYKPKGRSPMGFIPDFPSIFHHYGAWLTKKIQDVVKDSVTDPLFICPDEDAAKKIGRCLYLNYSNSLIRIPRKDLNEFQSAFEEKSHAELFTAWSKSSSRKKWLRLLQESIQSDGSVVLIDEFNLSGRTAKTMLEISNLAKRRVHSYIAIVDFNTTISSQLAVKEVHRFYSIDL